jgi:hypothetical protein
MNKKQIYGIGSLIDMIAQYPHIFCSSGTNNPKKYEWSSKTDEKHLIFIDQYILNSSSFKNKFKFAWLMEPECVIPNVYKHLENNIEEFDLIFTHDKQILSLSEKAKFTPFGGIWIEPENRFVQEKNKLNSFLFSEKRSTPGHRFRHEVAKNTTNFNIDMFGNGVGNHIESKTTSLKNYMFSIIIENSKTDYWFTEKIIDCFAVGTIPIYWGCPSIGNFFDTNGIIVFDTIQELEQILNNLSPEYYYDRLDSINKNFEISKKYWIADDYIYSYLKDYDII